MTTLEALKKVRARADFRRAAADAITWAEFQEMCSKLDALITAIQDCPVDDTTELANVCLT